MRYTEAEHAEARAQVQAQYTRIKEFRDSTPLSGTERRAFMAAALQLSMEQAAESNVPAMFLIPLIFRMLGAAYRAEVTVQEQIPVSPCCNGSHEPEIV